MHSYHEIVECTGIVKVQVVFVAYVSRASRIFGEDGCLYLYTSSVHGGGSNFSGLLASRHEKHGTLTRMCDGKSANTSVYS